MIYNQKFKMRDLFMNPKLEGVFPQFENAPLQNVYSFKNVEARILKYLKNALGGVVTGDNELTVKGNYKTVLRQVSTLKSLIEGFFNSVPKIAKSLRSNTKLYTPFASIGELAKIKSSTKKIAAMRVIIANLKYNPDFQSGKQESASYLKRQQAWKVKVGYKERA